MPIHCTKLSNQLRGQLQLGVTKVRFYGRESWLRMLHPLELDDGECILSAMTGNNLRYSRSLLLVLAEAAPAQTLRLSDAKKVRYCYRAV